MTVIRAILLILAIGLSPLEAAAQRYLSASPGCLPIPKRTMAVYPNGDIVVTGCAERADTDWLTVKFSANGAVLWSASHGTVYDESAAAVAIDGAGDVIVTGFTEDYYAGGRNIRTIKYHGTTGAQLWNVAHNPVGDDRGFGVAVDGAGNVFVTGETGTGYSRNIITLKYSGATGETLWTATLNGSYGGFDIGEAIAVDTNGDVFVTGLSGETDVGSNLRTIKYDGATGALIWTSHMGVSGDDSGLAAVIDPAGNLVVAGYTYSSASGSDYRVIKYASGNGDILWTTTIAGEPIAGDTALAVGVDSSGNVFVTGQADGGGYNMRTAKLAAATGAVLWNVSYNGPGNADDEGVSLAVDANGDVAITGSSDMCNAYACPTSHMRTIKYRGSDGAELWNVAYPDGGWGNIIGVDAAGDFIVGGSSHGEMLWPSHMRIVKYASATGAQIWTATEPILSGPGDFNADTKPDLVWSNVSSGATYVWYMDGPSMTSDAFIAGIDPSWKVQGIADFNADGNVDLVWRNTASGDTWVWYMSGTGFVADAFLFSLPPQWVIQGVADFNRDGKPDFLMRNAETGLAFVWFFSNAMPIGDRYLFTVDPVWKVEQVGDLNADGRPDLLFRNMDSGLAFAWYIWETAEGIALGTSSEAMFSIDPVWEVVQLADWNADNNPDLLFRNRDTGLVFVWYMTGTTLGSSQFVNQIDPSWEIVPRR